MLLRRSDPASFATAIFSIPLQARLHGWAYPTQSQAWPTLVIFKLTSLFVMHYFPRLIQ